MNFKLVKQQKWQDIYQFIYYPDDIFNYKTDQKENYSTHNFEADLKKREKEIESKKNQEKYLMNKMAFFEKEEKTTSIKHAQNYDESLTKKFGKSIKSNKNPEDILCPKPIMKLDYVLGIIN